MEHSHLLTDIAYMRTIFEDTTSAIINFGDI